MCPSPVARPSRHISRYNSSIALLTVTIIFATAATALAQRQPARGAAGRDAPAARGGYGASGAGSGGVGNTGPGSTAGNSAARKGDDAFPIRTAVAAGAAAAEYQKPTYEHYRLAPSPDGTMMALSGTHIEKENAGKKEERAKRDKAGKFIVNENVVEVIDVATGRSLVAFKPPMLFDNLALSPDNRFLAVETAARPGVVNVLHLPTRKSKEFKTELKRVVLGGLVFSSDGRSINVLAPDRMLTITIANGETKEVKFEITSPAASYTAAGNLVAVGVSRSKQGRPEVQIYDAATGKLTEDLDVPSAPARVQFSGDGKWLAATIAGGALVVWQTSDWTTTGRVAPKLGFEPEQLAVSSDGTRVAIRPRGTGREESKVIDANSGEVSSSVRTRDLFFLPTGALAVSNNRGPFYMDAASGNIEELPAGGAGAAALAQATAQAGFADSSGQPSAAAGYGSTAAAPAPNSQPGYGSTAPANASQPGYGSTAAPATNSQPGYGSTAASPNPDRAGYGATQLQPTATSSAAGQANTVESQVIKAELTKLVADLQKAAQQSGKSPSKAIEGEGASERLIQSVQKNWPSVLQVRAEDEQLWRDGKFNDAAAKTRFDSAVRTVEDSDTALPSLHVMLDRLNSSAKPTGARLELTARLFEALVPGQAQANTSQTVAASETAAAPSVAGYGSTGESSAPAAPPPREYTTEELFGKPFDQQQPAANNTPAAPAVPASDGKR